MSSIEALSTLPQLPPASKEQRKVMNWIDCLPRGATVDFAQVKNRKRFSWQTKALVSLRKMYFPEH
eukprot:10688169-Prorocentrum_lima.AAC.1